MKRRHVATTGGYVLAAGGGGLRRGVYAGVLALALLPASFACPAAEQAGAKDAAPVAQSNAKPVAGPADAAGTGVVAKAGRAPDTGKAAAALAPVKEIISPRIPAAEQVAYKLIKQAFDQNPAVQEYYRGKESVHLDLGQAAMLALEKNLAVDIDKRSLAYAKAALWEARSVFLPVFSLSYQLDQNNVRDRRQWGWVWRRAQIYKKNPTTIPAPQSPVTAIWWMPNRQGGYEMDWVYTSEKDKSRNDRQHTVTGSIAQRLPWGASLTISEYSYRRRRYYNSRKDSYDHPWTSTLSLSFSTPLPLTKDFGPYSFYDQNLKLRHVGTDRAAWAVKARVNQILLDVDQVYWTLAESLKILETTINNRLGMEQVVKQTNRLFAAHRTTIYGKQQVESELARVRAAEEGAWKNLLQASNRLAELLDYDPKYLLLPVNFTSRWQRPFDPGPGEPEQEALRDRPEVHVAEQDVVSADIMLKYYRNQTRPDLKYSFTQTRSQTGSTIGYETFLKSFGHLLDEDMRSKTHTLTYNYPLRNRANHARHRQAQGSKRYARLTLQDVRNLVRQEVHNARADLASTAARLAEARQGEVAAKKAFAQARALRRAGRMTEFEIIAKNRDLLAASTSTIQARIEYRRAVARFLAALGRISRKYGQLAAANDFDRRRLALLTGSGILKFF